MVREFESNLTLVVIHEFGQIKAKKLNKNFNFNLNFESNISATPNIRYNSIATVISTTAECNTSS